jgi:transposase
MTATRQHCSTTAAEGILYVSFELGWNKWVLCFTTGPGVKIRERTIRGRDVAAVRREIAWAKERLGLPATAAVCSCYEAGRDGFWVHRWLSAEGVNNLVVDAGSMLVNSKRKQAKTDRIDGRLLLADLLRHHVGEKRWSVVQVPSVEDEDRRQLHRELMTLKEEQTEHVNRLKGLLAGVGLACSCVTGAFPEWLKEARLYDGQPVPPELRERLVREHRRWQVCHEQIEELEATRQTRLQRHDPSDPGLKRMRQLLPLKAIGPTSAWLLEREIFGWRKIRNRRELGGLLGLTPTPRNSGAESREVGISKAGNRWVRAIAIEIAWDWLRWQRASRLSQWFMERFGKGSRRQRRIGIVALARKLVIALWRYREHGVAPEGAVLVDWRRKVGGVRACAAVT